MGVQTKLAIARREYDFSNLQGATGAEVVVHRALDVNYGEKAELLVRIHARNIGASSNIKVVARPVNLTAEEPDVDYLADAVATVTITSSSPTSVPALVLASFTAPFGPAIQLRVTGFCGTAPETVKATISVDIVCKD